MAALESWRISFCLGCRHTTAVCRCPQIDPTRLEVDGFLASRPRCGADSADQKNRIRSDGKQVAVGGHDLGRAAARGLDVVARVQSHTAPGRLPGSAVPSAVLHPSLHRDEHGLPFGTADSQRAQDGSQQCPAPLRAAKGLLQRATGPELASGLEMPQGHGVLLAVAADRALGANGAQKILGLQNDPVDLSFQDHPVQKSIAQNPRRPQHDQNGNEAPSFEGGGRNRVPISETLPFVSRTHGIDA